MAYIDGTVVQGSGSDIYVIEAGRRRRIPDPPTFIARGYSWNDITHIADHALKTLPLGEPLPSLMIPYATKQDSLGNDQHMATFVTLSSATNRIEVVTQMWTHNFWIGFTGGVIVLLVDAAGKVIGYTQTQVFEVDGLVVVNKPSARTDYWAENLPANLVAQTSDLAVVHKTAPPDRLAAVFAQVEHSIREAVEQAKAIGPVVIELSAIVA
jgi:hypothetical protein